ncbi:hypothetical protein AC781_00655 [Akkermansia glycaniphila]|nr:hypothetical protein AC781_00655 [Akkermansia glycaniphila]
MKIYLIILTLFLLPIDFLIFKFIVLKVFFKQNYEDAESAIFVSLFGDCFRDPSWIMIFLMIICMIFVHLMLVYFYKIIMR